MSILPSPFDHFQFALIHGPNIPGSSAILLFTASDLASITSHIHNWPLFLLLLHPFILSGVISPLISSSILDSDRMWSPREGNGKPLQYSCLETSMNSMRSLFSLVQYCTILWRGFSVHRILKRILEWIAMPSSRGCPQPRDQTHVSYISCIGRQVLYH